MRFFINKLRWSLAVCLIIIMLLGGGSVRSKGESFGDKKVQIDLTPHSKSAILIEAETGNVLYSKEPDLKLAPASMTKIMTLKLIFDALNQKRINLDDIVTTSEYAAGMGGSQIYLGVGEQMSVRDLLKSVGIASANDAAVALSEKISGSEANFVQMMNNEAKKMGLKNTLFQNSTGLPESNHYSTSRDMAILSQKLIEEHGQEVLALTSQYEDYIRVGTEKQFWLVNTNKLVKHVPGVDGIKTGWTEDAGYCLAATMQKDSMRVISVVMAAPSVTERTQDTMALLNYAFANFEKEVVLPKGTVVETIDNVLLEPHRINVITGADLVRIRNKNQEAEPVYWRYSIDYKLVNELKNQNIGWAKAYLGETVVDEVPLHLEIKSSRASFFSIFKEILKKIFT
ncbi:MAG: D-alanyl-D-alanine carboxypeptidase [Bacilli bacterium]|jgi:D-alanyl-D-alanine carboxypeptidase (penicillin-binding protein 5/6)|nr:D-alanyl-D-alanine carboxypeptidase [Bacilli bacterium]HHU24902.1 D-alanyl-D-alanine carboxypeptidase [Acholeplasmataceae bacterium]